MQDRFEELSSQVIRELTEVFSRMDDTNVRELLEEIKKHQGFFYWRQAEKVWQQKLLP